MMYFAKVHPPSALCKTIQRGLQLGRDAKSFGFSSLASVEKIKPSHSPSHSHTHSHTHSPRHSPSHSSSLSSNLSKSLAQKTLPIPFPQFDELPSEGTDYDLLKQSSTTYPHASSTAHRQFKDDLGKANDFLIRYRNVYGEMPAPTESAIELVRNELVGKKQRPRQIVYAIVVKLTLNTGEVGVGRGSCLTDARRAARLDLAERVFRANPSSTRAKCLPSKPVSFADSTVAFSISNRLQDQMKECFARLNEHRPFNDSSDVDDGKHVISAKRDRQWDGSTQSIPRTDKLFTQLASPSVSMFADSESTTTKSLPIFKRQHEIINAIESNQVTIISAATGSGKSTQIPQFIVNHFSRLQKAGYTLHGLVPNLVVTQPRRIAAKSLANRVATEMGEVVGQTVGYSVRFESVLPNSLANRAIHKKGSILFCTSGVLLRRLQIDETLSKISHLILDEVHDRDINTDLLLLLTKRLLSHRPDLRVVLMSATMQADKLTEYFRSAGFSVGNIFDVEGTNFPVAETYLSDINIDSLRRHLSSETCAYLKAEGQLNPYASSNMQELATFSRNLTKSPLAIDQPELEHIPYEIIAGLIRKICQSEPPGAILVFLPGWEEICQLQNQLQTGPSRLSPDSYHLHLLHSSSSPLSADAIFKPSPEGRRKIILATNIAESSLTIPDVTYVIDSGKQKVMIWDPRRRLDQLTMAWISKANLRQRIGRAGRCQPGKYYGMFSRTRMMTRFIDQSPPELLLRGLDEVVLQVRAAIPEITHGSIKDILKGALDSPDPKAVNKSVEQLIKLGALFPDESLSPLGRLLCQLPVHPAMGKMLCNGIIFKCLTPILTVVAACGEKVFKICREPEQKELLQKFLTHFGDCNNNTNVDEMKSGDQFEYSDHLLIHRIWSEWKKDPFGRQFTEYSSIISFNALKRIDDVRNQFLKLLNEQISGESIVAATEEMAWSSISSVRRHDRSRSLTVSPESDKWSQHDGIIRMVLASGLYPDVAILSKRNRLVLCALNNVRVHSTSVNYQKGTTSDGLNESIDEDEEADTMLDPNECTMDNLPRKGLMVRQNKGEQSVESMKRERPAFYIYQDLIDIGHVLVSRMTAVDPVVFSFFAGSVDSVNSGIQLDAWLLIKPEAKAVSGIEYLSELRIHFNEYLQHKVRRLLAGHRHRKLHHDASSTAISMEDAQKSKHLDSMLEQDAEMQSKLEREFESVLFQLIGETNIYRERMI